MVSSFYGLVSVLVFAGVFTSPIDNRLSFALPRKGNATVTLRGLVLRDANSLACPCHGRSLVKATVSEITI